MPAIESVPLTTKSVPAAIKSIPPFMESVPPVIKLVPPPVESVPPVIESAVSSSQPTLTFETVEPVPRPITQMISGMQVSTEQKNERKEPIYNETTYHCVLSIARNAYSLTTLSWLELSALTLAMPTSCIISSKLRSSETSLDVIE